MRLFIVLQGFGTHSRSKLLLEVGELEEHEESKTAKSGTALFSKTTYYSDKAR